MEAIRILMEEHRLIERALDVAEAMAAALRRGQDVARGDGEALLRFVADFADGAHHKKEEDGLFQWMQAQGFPAHGGPIGCMLAEHQEGRRLRAQAAAGLELGAEGTNQVSDALERYASLLRHHIQKEDQILYPMAEQLGDGDAELLPHYREVCPDQEELFREFRALVEDLLSRPWADGAGRSATA